MNECAMNGNAHPGLKPGRKFGLTGSRNQQQTPDRFSLSSSTQNDDIRLWINNNRGDAALSEQEMEDKYNAIRLAIRTEGLTLKERLEHHRGQRDVVENNLNREVGLLQSYLMEMKEEVSWAVSHPFEWPSDKSSSSINDRFVQMASQIESVLGTAHQISRCAESLGAAAYETRMSAAIKALVLYVEHVRRKWEKEHRELDEIKRILTESGVNVAKCLAALPSRQQQQQPANNMNHKRRASFPASPYNRRMSLIKTAGAFTPLDVNKVVAIAEEKDETVAPTSVTPLVTLSAACVKVEADVCPPLVCSPLDPSSSTDQLRLDRSVTTSTPPPPSRRRGRTGKSHSWSSGLVDAIEVEPSVEEAEMDQINPDTVNVSTTAALLMSLRRWIHKADQWRHRRTHRPAQQQQSNGVDKQQGFWSWMVMSWPKWNGQRLLVAFRFIAAAALVVAALFSLLVTFIPSLFGHHHQKQHNGTNNNVSNLHQSQSLVCDAHFNCP